ncbi:unnamed protein product [Citrullus colocynthis]|uniref:Uncharacterized protein n=1 Tax=Citrullus colocynthis TaxID=252529 RepID=A0ABP0XMI1_9ROSI
MVSRMVLVEVMFELSVCKENIMDIEELDSPGNGATEVEAEVLYLRYIYIKENKKEREKKGKFIISA